MVSVVPGLIPAWAGKTWTLYTTRLVCGAHPRVGGENRECERDRFDELGSSPRGRGKLSHQVKPPHRKGLIPAWAGKTAGTMMPRTSWRAHPRVGGENPLRDGIRLEGSGSSPRGRGKRRQGGTERAGAGLIPAWAGKTRLALLTQSVTRAHPRVGGENKFPGERRQYGYGSSPRGRGKPHLGLSIRHLLGLIPAWAGKTTSISVSSRGSWAHPRVGGENVRVALSIQSS